MGRRDTSPPARARFGRATVFGTLALGIAVTFAAACEQPAERRSSGGDGDTDEGYSPSSVSIATGTSSGVYYPIGGAMQEIINDHVDGVSASAEATAASVENMVFLDDGTTDLAIAQGDVVYQAYHGEGAEFADAPIDSRVLMVLYPNVYHAVSLRSIHADLELNCFSDIEGHRFSVGAAGSGNELATNLVFDALGLDPDEDISRQRYAYAETASALREGQLDAGSWVVGEGHGTLQELEATDPIHLIPICPDEVDTITEQYPFYAPHTIDSDVYSTIEEDVETIALWNVIAVPPDLSEDAAYELVRSLYENVDFINQVYQPGAEYLNLNTLEQSPIPLHPGTIRYAEEQGVEVPEELRP